MRLDVGKARAKKFFGALNGGNLCLIGKFLPAIVALARVALRVLVSQNRALRLAHCLGNIIFRRN